nr:succinate--CoA ligase subunit alpha [Candidatus Atribacteria bacterium]
IPGSSFVDLLPLFEEDSQTDLIVIVGEIGGSDEEIAAKYIKEHMKKPVVAFIAGEAAPEGKVMGHAGAIFLREEKAALNTKEKYYRMPVFI